MALILATASLSSSGQIQRTSVPIGDAVSKALAKGSLTGEGARPFHIRVEVSEPENPQSPYQGAFEEWWASPDQWRRVVTDKDGMKQTIVIVGGRKTEKDEGDYLPVWLRTFVKGVFDPVPNPDHWTAGGLMIEKTVLPGGAHTDACVRSQSKIGSADRSTNVYFNLCFDDEGTLKSVLSPGYFMQFQDYRSFGKKKIARTLTDSPESGTKLVGQVTVLEELSKAKNAEDPFIPLPADEDRFNEVQASAEDMEKFTAANPSIVWPTVHSGNLKGKEAVYVSFDSKGRAREVWPLNSDNGGVDDSTRDQVRKWTIKPATDKTGKPVQVDGSLIFAFDTRIDDPIPELSDSEIRQLAITTVQPVWPAGAVKSGDVIEIDLSVNEQGRFAGSSLRGKSVGGYIAANNALHQWTFRPLVRDGKPHNFHGIVKFIVP